MKKLLNYQLILLLMICFTGKAVFAQSNGNWTEKTAKQWFDKGEWRHGLNLKAYPGIDYVEFAKQYHANKALWDKAFAYIRNTNLQTVPVGKYPIDGDNAFATVTDGPTKPFGQTAWESHRKYVDLHLLISGKEKIGVMNPATAKVIDPYDASKDIAHYDPATKGTYYIAGPGTFFLFFPQNSHRPSIHVNGYDKVKKLVIKVKMAD